MKQLMIGLCAFLLSGVMGCADDNDPKDDDTLISGEAYATISITVPNDGGSRADVETGDGVEAGSADEYAVKNATLYFFKPAETNDNAGSTGILAAIKTVTNFSMEGPDLDSKVVYTSAKTELSIGRYRVYAVVNGTVSTTIKEGTTTEADFLKDVNATKYEAGIISTETAESDGLVMASRTAPAANTTVPYSVVTIAAANNINNPAQINMEVERVVGKLTLKTKTKNEFELKSNSATYATVELVDYAIVNARKDFFTFRHVVSSFTEGSEPTYEFGTTNGYVMDPKTYSKVNTTTDFTTAADWYANHVTTSLDGKYKTMPTVNKENILGYCLENTMSIPAQKQGFATGVIFKAKITPAENNYYSIGDGDNLVTTAAYTSGTLYFYNNKFYASIAALKKAGVLLAAATTDEAIAGADGAEKTAAFADLANFDIRRFVDGYCYYKYWIKHLGGSADNSIMGAMEYAIVRNNVYKMEVTGVNGLGQGDTGKGGNDADTSIVTPGDDCETQTVYIQVKMTIKPWIVRKNDITLG